MGLLDILQGDGGQNGLLDFLRANALNQPMPGLLASDTADYGQPAPMSFAPPQQTAPIAANQPSSLDTAQWPSGPVGAPTVTQAPLPPAIVRANQPSPLDSAAYPAGPVGAPSNANASMPAPMSMAGPAPAVAPNPPPVIAAAPVSTPASSGAGDRMALGAKGFLGNLQGGPVGALLGGLGALVSGEPTDATTIASQKLAKTQNITAQALLAKGIDPQTVAAAIQPGNTEMLKTLVTQAFGPKTATSLGNGYIYHPDTGKTERAYEPDDKFQHVTVKNADGSESPQAFNPSTGQYIGAPPAAPNKFSVDPSLTGQDRLEALRAVDPLYARKIESMVNGDLPMPTGVAALRPDAKRMIEDALAVDGSTSASDFQTRAATRKDYASGIASRVTKSINTTIGHFATLDQAVDKLGNYSYFPKIANAVHDVYASNTDPNYQKAKATFETNKEAAVKELDFALSGGHSSVSGSAELRDKFNRADSPEALHAAITEAMSLLQKRLESHTKAFTEGTKSQRDPQDFIYPENRQAFGHMLGQPDAASAAPVQAGAPAPGAYVWTPGGGLVGRK